MALVYNPFDVFAVQRNATSSSFVETILRATPNSVIIFDSASTITTKSTQSFAQDIISASLTQLTASYALALAPGANIFLDNSFIFSNF